MPAPIEFITFGFSSKHKQLNPCGYPRFIFVRKVQPTKARKNNIYVKISHPLICVKTRNLNIRCYIQSADKVIVE